MSAQPASPAPSPSLDAALARLAGALRQREAERDALAWARRSRDSLQRHYGAQPLDPGQARVLADLDTRIATLEAAR